DGVLRRNPTSRCRHLARADFIGASDESAVRDRLQRLVSSLRDQLEFRSLRLRKRRFRSSYRHFARDQAAAGTAKLIKARGPSPFGRGRREAPGEGTRFAET